MDDAVHFERRRVILPVVLVICILLPMLVCTQAEAQQSSSKRSLTNVQIQYVERLPNGIDPPDSPTAKLGAIFRKQERQAGIEVSVTEPVTGIDLIKMAADKTAVGNGYLDAPIPLLSSFVRAFESRGISSSPVFQTNIRNDAQRQVVRSELTKRFGTSTQQDNFSLTMLPYRASFHEPNDALLRIGLALYDLQSKEWVWVHLLTVPFGSTRGRLTDVDADRLASNVVAQLSKDGWISTAK